MTATCPICSEVLSCELCAAPCGHVFHQHCIAVWMRQKQECPLCKSTCAAHLLTPLQYHPKQLLLDFQHQHQHQPPQTAPPASSSSSSPSSPSSPSSDPFSTSSSSSPFTLSLRLQSLRSQLADTHLLRTQQTETLTSLHSRLTSLTTSLTPLQSSVSDLTSSLSHLTSDLARLRASHSSATQSHQRMQRRRRTLLRQLLVLRCVGPVREVWREGGHVDLEALLRVEERRLPRVGQGKGRGVGEEEAGAREEAVELLMRVMIGEVQREVEEVQRKYKAQVQDKRRDIAENDRAEQRCAADRDRLLEQKRQLEQQRQQMDRRKAAWSRKQGGRGGEGESKEEEDTQQRQHRLASALSAPLLREGRGEGKEVKERKRRRTLSAGPMTAQPATSAQEKEGAADVIVLSG